MQRYFLKNSQFQNGKVWITEDDAHHIIHVMRLKVGESVIVCDEDKACYQMSITTIKSNKVLGEILSQIKQNTELPIKVTLAQGLTKGDKFEWILQKGTECGANQFIPVTMERSIVKLDSKKAEKKLERWLKIVKEAAEQSHRQALASVHSIVDFKYFLTLAENYDVCLFADEEMAKIGEMSQLKQTLTAILPGKSILILIGPEGGISRSEVSMLTENGFVPCGLGPRILRTETAPIYLLSAISYALEL